VVEKASIPCVIEAMSDLSGLVADGALAWIVIALAAASMTLPRKRAYMPLIGRGHLPCRPSTPTEVSPAAEVARNSVMPNLYDCESVAVSKSLVHQPTLGTFVQQPEQCRRCLKFLAAVSDGAMKL
jgi:hypothetical protein